MRTNSASAKCFQARRELAPIGSLQRLYEDESKIDKNGLGMPVVLTRKIYRSRSDRSHGPYSKVAQPRSISDYEGAGRNVGRRPPSMKSGLTPSTVAETHG
jgi:hypothetical protein